MNTLLEKDSFYQVLSAEAYSKHGFNIHGVVFDELHTQPNRKLFDVMTKGSGDARMQPLYFLITTAGTDTKSICYETHQKAKDLLEGRKIDPTFYPVIYGADENDDWTDPKVWKKANPSLGITVGIDKVKAACESAKQNPAEENAFRQLRLNQWVKQAVRWMLFRKFSGIWISALATGTHHLFCQHFDVHASAANVLHRDDVEPFAVAQDVLAGRNSHFGDRPEPEQIRCFGERGKVCPALRAVSAFPVHRNRSEGHILFGRETLAVLIYDFFYNACLPVHSAKAHAHTFQSRSSRKSRLTVFHTCRAASGRSAKKPPVDPSRDS